MYNYFKSQHDPPKIKKIENVEISLMGRVGVMAFFMYAQLPSKGDRTNVKNGRTKSYYMDTNHAQNCSECFDIVSVVVLLINRIQKVVLKLAHLINMIYLFKVKIVSKIILQHNYMH